MLNTSELSSSLPYYLFIYFLSMQDLDKHVWALRIPSPLLQEETRKHLTWELRDLVSFPGSNASKQRGPGQVPPWA